MQDYQQGNKKKGLKKTLGPIQSCLRGGDDQTVVDGKRRSSVNTDVLWDELVGPVFLLKSHEDPSSHHGCYLWKVNQSRGRRRSGGQGDHRIGGETVSYMQTKGVRK